jgi:hypothetical protein
MGKSNSTPKTTGLMNSGWSIKRISNHSKQKLGLGLSHNITKRGMMIALFNQ